MLSSNPIAPGARSLIVVQGFLRLRFLVTAIEGTLEVIVLVDDVGVLEEGVGGCRYAKSEVLLHLQRVQDRLITDKLRRLIYYVPNIVGCNQRFYRATLDIRSYKA